jgi:hypothetical protein
LTPEEAAIGFNLPSTINSKVILSIAGALP